MKRKILLYLFILNLLLSINIFAINLNFKGGLAYKQDSTETISSTTANNGTTYSDTPTKLAFDSEMSFYTGSNIEAGVGVKYAFLTVSQEAAATALSNDMQLTDLTAYGLFKINYSAYNQDGETLNLSPYLQLNVGLPSSATDAGDGSYTLVGKSFYELCIGIEYLDTSFEISYANQRYEIDEQTDLTYLDVETINFKIGVKFRVFEGKGNSTTTTETSNSYY